MTLRWLHAPDAWFWITVVAAVLALVWAFARGRNRPRLRWIILLRSTGLLLLVIGLLQPLIRRTYVEVKPLSWAVYLDNSISMGFHANPSPVSLKSGIQDLLAAWSRTGAGIDVLQFSHRIDPYDESNYSLEGTATNLGQILEDVEARKDQLAGAIIITDGQLTEGQDPRDLIRQGGVPLYTIGVGDSTPMVDVYVESIDVPTVAIKGEPVEARVTLSSTGEKDHRVTVSLYSRANMLGSRFIRLSGEGSRSDVKFRFTPGEIGPASYRVQVSSVPEEINVENNSHRFDITVLKDRYNVAVLTGSPGYNTAVIKRLLGKLPRVKIDHFVQVGNSFRPKLKTFWSTPYELIVFDNFPATPLPRTWQNFFARKIIAHQSSLAWIAGPDIDRDAARSLHPFFYVRSPGNLLEQDLTYPLHFTDWLNSLPFLKSLTTGPQALHQVDFPPLHPGLQLETTRADQWIIAAIGSGDLSVPALILGEKDILRYAVWSPEDLATTYYQLLGSPDQDAFSHLFERVINWLLKTSGDREMYFRLNKSSFQQGELISITGNRILPTGPSARGRVKIKSGEDVINTVDLRYQPEQDRWEGEFYAPSPGKYTYEVEFLEEGESSTQSGEFRVQESQVELNQVRLNSRLLQSLAQQTGGRYVPWVRHEQAASWVQPRSRTEVKFSELHYMEHPWIWGIVFVIFVVEWILRRTLGLP
ncbi:MAG: VWA domain-containing protein [Candidatus Neomarinimicrobiota bacterium]|nr:MAG: VWA domain-containing protein [Candidatus Neomarinimicrobiota bacterium]